MRKIKLSSLLWLLLSIMITSGFNGCGQSATTSYYYYYPDWMPDGKIICVKEVRTYQEVGYPAGVQTSSKYYITTMSEEGTQETDIKQIIRLGKVSASPQGNYIAYTEGNYIKIITATGAEYSNANASNSIGAIDWRHDEEILAFSTNGVSWESFLINRNGQNIRKIFNGISPNWSYDGMKIIYDVYYYSGDFPVWEGLFLYVVSTEASTRITTQEGGNPEFLPGDKYIVFDNGKTCNIQKKSLDTGEIVNITNEKVYFPKWSQDNTKILYSKGVSPGIWMSNTDGNSLKQIR